MSERQSRGHEPADVRWQRVVWVAVGLFAALVLVTAAAGAMMHWLGPPRMSRTAAPAAPTAPGPQLQPDPARDLATLRREKYAMLHEYAWLDRRAGIVRIPIERAMELAVARASPPQPEPRR